jgi:hypothetical protein
MSPEYVAALAESVGALAVVVSLLYVARQVRQTGQQARLATIHAVNSQFHTVMQLTAANPEVARIWTTGLLRGTSALEDDEVSQFTQLLGLVVSSYQHLFYYREEGLIDDERFRVLETPYLGELACRGFADWWEMFGTLMPRDFQAYVANRMVEAGRDIDLGVFDRLASGDSHSRETV